MTVEDTEREASVIGKQTRRVTLVSDCTLSQQPVRGEMPLIFNSLEVPRSALIPTDARPLLLLGKRYAIRAFSGPGDNHRREVDAIEMTDSSVRFPGWGHWRFVAAFGAVKLLLLDPKLASDDVPRHVLSFVAANIWHCLNDHYLARPRLDKQTFHFADLAEKFFNSDQPLGLHCGDATSFLCVIMDYLGYRTRMISLTNNGGGGHLFPEVWLPHSQSWAILDPDFGIMLQVGDRWIDTETMIALAVAGRGDAIQVVDVGNKCFPAFDTQVPVGFFGQLTWHPEFLNPRLNAPYIYIKNIIRKQPMNLQFRPVSVVRKATSTIGR